MLSKRYTVVLADRTTGVVRRLTISVKPVVIAIVTVVTLPILIGTGAALKARYDVRDLYASNATLELENANYRAATEQLAGQIMALQTSMSDLGAKAHDLYMHGDTQARAALRVVAAVNPEMLAWLRDRLLDITAQRPEVSEMMARLAKPASE